MTAPVKLPTVSFREEESMDCGSPGFWACGVLAAEAHRGFGHSRWTAPVSCR